MPGLTDVVLITGFLGSGKTTLLNHLIEQFPADRRLMVLMNEFGEIGIDGHLIAGEDLDLLEISNGSVFCACVKTDFIRGLDQIARKIKPDMLVIEATGVADPTDMKRDLTLSIFKQRFRFREQICVIDAQHFVDAYEAFSSVEKQVESATLFVINKVDLVTQEDVAAIKAIIGRHHSQPVFLESCFAQLHEAQMTDFFAPFDRNMGVDESAKSTETVEDTIAELMRNPRSGMQPADDLYSAVYHWRGRDLGTLQQFGAAIPPGIIRAKGFIIIGHQAYLFSQVMTSVDINPIQAKDIPTTIKDKIVFIGEKKAIDALVRLEEGYPIIACQPDVAAPVVQILP